MTEPVVSTERVAFDEAGVRRAAEVIAAGGLVAFPTETVYGLGARADRAEAVRRIFAAKGRPATNPLIVHVATVDEARALASSFGDAAEKLARAFWPGPLTLVVPRREGAVPDEITGGGDTIALRCPAHPAARALLEATRLPIAAPSANRSTSISPTTADHVLKSLGGRIDLVLDAGPTGAADPSAARYGIESTIVDVTGDRAVVLRAGPITRERLAEHVALADTAAPSPGPGEPSRAPGAGALHYAPRAPLFVVAKDELFDEVVTRRAKGKRVGILERAPGSGFDRLCETLPDDAAAFGASLYEALHRLDDAGCDVILAVEVPSGGAWDAARDRLHRAAGEG
jgi:L-threonylcarbamoyladenylate synthase